MIKRLLINRKDIEVYRDISYSMDQRELDTYIREAQIQDLQPLLNPYLYADFINKICDNSSAMYQDYQRLLNGVEYQDNTGQWLIYYGIKPMLVYFTYARILQKSSVKATRTGMVVKTTEESNPADGNTVMHLVTDARSLGVSYQDQVKKFLCDNSDIYTLWRQDQGTQVNNKKGFEFTKAQVINSKLGESYDPGFNY